ncbi:MAG: hypothetical protein LBJ00_17470 [Planctomycetaceae bacterium]|nr:hypothetical protein [Planctomycetaceae bacterium]
METDEKLQTIRLVTDQEKLQEISKLDGCYCLTTSLNVDELDKESVHARYKDLAMVEECVSDLQDRSIGLATYLCAKTRSNARTCVGRDVIVFVNT